MEGNVLYRLYDRKEDRFLADWEQGGGKFLTKEQALYEEKTLHIMGRYEVEIREISF
jgi:hypothetical protein